MELMGGRREGGKQVFDYPLVVHLGLDVIVFIPMDDAFDLVLKNSPTNNDNNVAVAWKENPLPKPKLEITRLPSGTRNILAVHLETKRSAPRIVRPSRPHMLFRIG